MIWADPFYLGALSFSLNEAYLGWEAQGTRTSSSLFQTRSSLNSDRLASPMFVLPFAAQGLFPLVEKTKAHEEGAQSPFAPCHCQHIIYSFRQFMEIILHCSACCLFSARNTEFCQTLTNPASPRKAVFSCPSVSCLSSHFSPPVPLLLVSCLCRFSIPLLGILPDTH